jgi:hypothetical protein
MSHTRRFVVLGLLLVLTLATPSLVRADDTVDPRALNRARTFLNDARQGQHVLGYMHAGTSYAGRKHTETRLVTDRAGNRIPGHFAVIYAYDWNKDGTTDVAFLCDRRGNVYEVKVLASNAIINQPFAVADATIQLLGNLLIEAFKDNMTAEDRKQVRKAVADADAKGLLETSLKLQQAFGK